MTMNAWPDHLLTLEEWSALPEAPSHHVELADGVLIAAPRPAPWHQIAAGHLMSDLNRQLPATLYASQDVEVVIESSFPATVRAPDVLVIAESLFRSNPARIDAREVLLAVELISPGSTGTDRFTKTGEYAGAGIPHYWVIDLSAPSLTTYALVGDHYEVTQKVTGPVTLSEPATLAVDVSRLLHKNYAARDL
jgi:Uma2 family endonuclease